MSGTNEDPNGQPGAADPAGNSAGAPPAKPNTQPSGFTSLEEANAEIAKLRKENGDRRTKSKDLEGQLNALTGKFSKVMEHLGIKDQEADPAEALKQVTSQAEEFQMEASFQHLARVHNIPVENDDYFRFLLGKKLDSLEEGQEVTDEDLAAIVQQVAAVSGQKKSSTGVNANGGNGKPPPPPNSDNGDVTAEKFKKMSTLEKSHLYTKDPQAYERLKSEAKLLK